MVVFVFFSKMAEANFSLKIQRNIRTSKNEEQVLCENFLYYKKRFNEKSKTTYWQCSFKDCNATITTLSDDSVQKVNGQKISSHDPVILIGSTTFRRARFHICVKRHFSSRKIMYS